MIYCKQSEDTYEIRFQYNQDIISMVKNVPGRRWVPESKMWTIPKDKLGWLLNEFKGTAYESQLQVFSDDDINVNQTLDVTQDIPQVDISKIPFYVVEGGKPYKHQLDFMKFAIDRQLRGHKSGFILADEMGAGKTLEVMNLALYNKKQYKFKHCLIICCVNSAKYNWKRDIELHTNGKESPYVLGTRLRRDGRERPANSSQEKFEDLKVFKKYGKRGGEDLPFFLILNIEALRYKSGRTYPISDTLIKLMSSGKISMVALDEIHKNTSPSSMQGKQLLRIKKNVKAGVQWIPMTGTPITNKPTDVFLPLKLIDAHSYTSYFKWCQEFCIYGGFGGYEIMGYKNIPKLKTMLQGNMLRRLKSDILDLPPKIYFTEYIENTSYQQKLYDDVVQEIWNQKDDILSNLNPMTKFLKLRQVNGSPELVDFNLDISSKDYISKNSKLQRLMELLEDIHDRGEKVLIFSNWVEPLRTLYQYISKKYKVCCFTGTMKPEDRERHKEVFINNPNYTVMLGTVGAMGTSHTFTVARNVIFYDEPWTPSDKEQAEDRCHRVGTQDSVNIFTLITSNTVDERVHDILYTKKGVSQYIIDNKLDLRKNPKLFDLLLSRDK